MDTTLRGLRPRTSYNIHILAENAIGRSQRSKLLTITTDDEGMKHLLNFLFENCKVNKKIKLNLKMMMINYAQLDSSLAFPTKLLSPVKLFFPLIYAVRRKKTQQ